MNDEKPAPNKKSFNTENIEADRVIILAKTAEDLAESIEIMVVETRPLGMARAGIRGACCLLRGEPTNINPRHALFFLNALYKRWEEQKWEQRQLIVTRAMKIIMDKYFPPDK